MPPTVPRPRPAETARNANTIRSYQRYLDQYPRGVFEDIARARQDDLRDDATRDKDRAELEAIEANLGLNKSSRTLVERRLELLGYRPGNVDGVFDATTRGAIRRFQQASRITVTGYLNANTVRQLIVASVR